MQKKELKNLFQKSNLELFVYFQKRKSFFFLVNSITLYLANKNEYSFVLDFSLMFAALSFNSFISIFFKKQFKVSRIINVVFLGSEFLSILLFIHTFYLAKYVFMLWIIPIWALVFISTNKRFSLFLAVPLIATFILSFLRKANNINLLDNYMHLEVVFFINLFCVVFFLFSLFYGKSGKNYFQGPIEQLKDKFNTALSFPRNNPFPILEFTDDKGIMAKNIAGENVIKNLSNENIKMIKGQIDKYRKVNEQNIDLIKIKDTTFKIAYATYAKQINIYMIDISEIEDARSMAIENEQYAMAIIDAIPGFVSWIDSEKRYLGLNKKMQDFFNLGEDDFIGKKVGDIYGNKSSEKNEIHHFVNKLFDSNEKMIQEELKFSFNGIDYYNILTMNKYNEDKNAVLVSVDITEVKKMEKKVKEEQLKAQSSAKLASFGEMAAGIAHEINNPLSVISGMIGILKKVSSMPEIDVEKINHIANKVNQSIDRINRIIKGMKNLARDGTGDPFEYALVAEILDDTHTLFNKKCLNKNINLEILDYPITLGLECQLVQIGQVIVILLNNSIDAIEDLKDKWIKIEVKDFYQNLIISITDSGKGIPDEFFDKIFGPFFTTKAVGKGTGLGLSLAHRIIQSHNGKIIVDRECENTKFDIILPKRQRSIAA